MKFWLLKLKLSFGAIGRLLLRPAYLIAAVLIALLTLGVVLWAFNLNLLRYILSEPTLMVIERLWFLVSIYGSVLTNFESLVAVSLVLFSALFGINLAALIFVIKQKGKIVSSGGKSAGGIITAIIGAGCAACGTSIISPVLAALGASGSIALAQSVGLAINIASIIIMFFSIYASGKLVANFQARTANSSSP